MCIRDRFYTDVCIANLPDTAIVTEVAPEIEWQNTIGGIDTDRVWAGVEQTIDGGYIPVSYTHLTLPTSDLV